MLEILQIVVGECTWSRFGQVLRKLAADDEPLTRGIDLHATLLFRQRVVAVDSVDSVVAFNKVVPVSTVGSGRFHYDVHQVGIQGIRRNLSSNGSVGFQRIGC